MNTEGTGAKRMITSPPSNPAIQPAPFIQILKNWLAVLALLIIATKACHAQVYAHGVHSGGTTYYRLCEMALPSQLQQFKITEVCWLEDSNGLTYIGIGHIRTQSDVSRASLLVESGTNTFRFALDQLSAAQEFTLPNRAGENGGLPLIKGAGDLGQMTMQCVITTGNRALTNTLPTIPVFWVQHSTGTGDFFMMKGDHFNQIQQYLELVFGKQVATIHSDESQPGSRSVTYMPAESGVILNLTSGLDLTMISIIGKQKP